MLNRQQQIFKTDLRICIEEYGLPFVLYCLEKAIERNATPKAEILIELNIPELLEKPKRFEKSKVSKEGESNIRISELAQRRYNLEVVGGRCKCPIHFQARNKTSFVFFDDKNVFKCFSCGISGGLVKFIKLMEERKNAKEI